MSNSKRIMYLESKMPKTVLHADGVTQIDVESKYSYGFNRYARYLGNGVYTWRGITATCTRELFLMGVLKAEGIKFKEL